MAVTTPTAIGVAAGISILAISTTRAVLELRRGAYVRSSDAGRLRKGSKAVSVELGSVNPIPPSVSHTKDSQTGLPAVAITIETRDFTTRERRRKP